MPGPPLWERQPKDTPASFKAFIVYRDLDDRSHTNVVKALGRQPGYQRSIERWSADHNWVERAAAYDAHLDSLKVKAAEDIWVERGRQYAEDAWRVSGLMLERAAELLELPLYQLTKVRDEDGYNVTEVYEPLGWRATDIVRFNKESFKLREIALEHSREAESGDGLLLEFVKVMKEAYAALPAQPDFD